MSVGEIYNTLVDFNKVVQIFDDHFPILGPFITDFVRLFGSTSLFGQICTKLSQVLIYVYIVQTGIGDFCCFDFFFAE